MTLGLKFAGAMLIFAACQVCADPSAHGQSRPTPIRTAYSAVSAGIGTLWMTQEDGRFKRHGGDSNLIYIHGGATAVHALLAGEIHFCHLAPAPMMTARPPIASSNRSSRRFFSALNL